MGATGLEPVDSSTQGYADTPVTAIPAFPLAHSLAHEMQNRPEIDPDLARVLDAWPTLPQPLRDGILAMIDGARRA
jgi:hypothetical protein